ncbi:MAG: hypothetical protein LBF77_07245 [Spirochaetaceae bacterium]|jgi:transposase|nr:hypothetical protein [Spirochaetaceae bacterium]
MKLPVYYRLLGGNIVDVAAMALCVKEMGVSGVVYYIADKGLYSADNVVMQEEKNLKYIMPVCRNNSATDYGPIGDGEFKMKHRHFIRQGRVIWYYQYEASGHGFITCLDDRPRMEEEQDYLTRITTHPDGHTEAGYQERLRRFWTVTLTCRMSGAKIPDEVYMAYKRRNEIERD